MSDTGTVHLVAMKGHPATGKSVIAETLARRLLWPLTDKDDIKDHLLDLPDANERAYAIMWQIVGKQLALGANAIAVSPLSYPSGYAEARRLAGKYRAQLLVIETVLDEAEWRDRLERRSPGHSTHKISGWAAMEEMLRTYDGCWQYPIDPVHHLFLDTGQSPAVLIPIVLNRLGL